MHTYIAAGIIFQGYKNVSSKMAPAICNCYIWKTEHCLECHMLGKLSKKFYIKINKYCYIKSNVIEIRNMYCPIHCRHVFSQSKCFQLN